MEWYKFAWLWDLLVEQRRKSVILIRELRAEGLSLNGSKVRRGWNVVPPLGDKRCTKKEMQVPSQKIPKNQSGELQKSRTLRLEDRQFAAKHTE